MLNVVNAVSSLSSDSSGARKHWPLCHHILVSNDCSGPWKHISATIDLTLERDPVNVGAGLSVSCNDQLCVLSFLFAFVHTDYPSDLFDVEFAFSLTADYCYRKRCR